MAERVDHPCLTCPLPDCDDTDSRCSLRRALAAYSRQRRQGVITQTVRARYSIAYNELYGADRNARRKVLPEANHA